MQISYERLAALYPDTGGPSSGSGDWMGYRFSFNLCRMFNVREGISRADDALPARLGEPLPEGASAGEIVSGEDLEKLLEEYYELRGWDKNGIPRPETLARLGLI